MPSRSGRSSRDGVSVVETRSRLRRSSCIPLSILAAFAAASPAPAAETVYVGRASEWSYLPGLSPASAPDPDAWRAPDFDASEWPRGQAPFGYGLSGDPPDNTDMNALDPPMQRNYTSLYLRTTFEMLEPELAVALHARVNFDDGFILWINGVEVLRANAFAGAAYDSRSDGSHESGSYEEFDELPNLRDFVRAGTNVVAVHAFNATPTSGDFKFDVEIYDPFGPDLAPPAMRLVTPPPGRLVRSLDAVEVTFDEEVLGVDAGDLEIDGIAASAVEGSGAGPYVFTFAPAGDGVVDLAWRDDHGISDVSERRNAFGGGAWSYRVDSTLPEFDLVLSEFAAAGSPEDWIEILNRGVTFVDLEGWSLSDDASDPDRWVFPSRVLAPGEYLVVEASGEDRRDPGAPLHASFSLAQDGEYLGLFPPASPRVAISQFASRYPAQRAGISYGIDSEGRPSYFTQPTPGAPNAAGSMITGILPAPLFDRPHGIAGAPFDLVISSPFVAEVWYTTDGSEPSPGNGTLYERPIRVEPLSGRGVAMVRAAAFRDGFLSSEIVTRSWVFPELVLAQPNRPAGIPAAWGTQQADYAVDPSVVGRNPDDARSGLVAIPTLSIVTDVANLFDSTRGIYANPSRQGFEVPVSLEIIEPDASSAGVQIDCGLRVQGGSSTGGWKSIKVSLRAAFRGEYGAKKLRFPVFPDSPVDTFDSLVLDAHLNLAYTHPDHSQRVRSQFVRDLYVCDIQRAAGSLAPYGRFMHLYLNGLYWGMYDIHERPDDAFASEHLGGDKDDWDIYRHTQSLLVDGNSAAWTAMQTAVRQNQALLANHVSVHDHLDVADLCDYMAVNFWTGNTDWAHHNWYAGADRTRGAFRFFSWDAEHVLKSPAENVTGKNDSGAPTGLHQSLRASPEYRVLFGDRWHRLVREGGPLWVDPTARAVDDARPENNRPAAIYMRRIQEIWTAVILESARWGDAERPGQPYTRDAEFAAELNGLRATFFPNRTATVTQQLQSLGLYPRVAAPSFSRAPGGIEAGAVVSLSKPANQNGVIWVTADGSDPRNFGTGAVAPAAFEYVASLRLDDTTRVKARVLDGADWSALAEGLFTLVTPDDALRVTELHYHPPEGESEFIEVANLSDVTVELGGARFTNGIEFSFPDSFAVAPGERVVLVSDAALFAASHPGVAFAGEYASSLADEGERVTLSDADAALVLTLEYGDGAFWPRGPDGLGFSLVFDEAGGGDPDDGRSWRSSAARGGSPGAPESRSAPYGVWISEALARSTDPYEDAIELFNSTSSPIDIGAWYLSDDRSDAASLMKFEIPEDTIIDAGGWVVLYERDFNADPDDPASFALSAGGDEVFLASAADGELTGLVTGYSFGASLEGVSFGIVDSSEGPKFAPTAQPSFGVVDPISVEAFRTGAGAPNAGARAGEIVLNEIHYNPRDGFEFIELHNRSAADIHLYEPDADAGWRIDGIRNSDDTREFEFPEGIVVPPGGFVVVVPTEPEVFISQVDVPATAIVVGPYRGALDNAGERIRLLAPSIHGPDLYYVAVDSVRFNDRAPWPLASDGQGPSLERIDAAIFGDQSANWAASKAGGGTPGRTNSASEPGVNQRPHASFLFAPGAQPRAIVLDASASIDPDGEIAAFLWDFGDGASGSGVVVEHIYATGGVYDVILTVVDADGADDSTSSRIPVIDPARGGQLPGDANQDGALNLSDAVSLLAKLFLGRGDETPCDGSLTMGGNLALLDFTVDRRLDLTDAVAQLNYLFQSGPPHGLGTACVPIDGCSELCAP